ncbi:MAG TPA: phosphotransferase [Bacilli bacterium]|nr:phosphotransferase [Bacilli bacterium]
MHTKQIKEVFIDYLQTEDYTLEIKERFLGGMSNFTYHVIVNGTDYVVRIANQTGREFVSYPGEKLHLHLVEPFLLTSKTLYYNLESGNKIAEYIPGENLANSLNAHDLENVARLLRELHATKIEGIDYDLVGRFTRYEKLVDSLSPLYYELKAFWLNEYKATYAKIAKIFTHGDVQRTNIIRGPRGYFLVDFEFAGMNDPFIDIAGFGNIDFNDALNLLPYYLKKPATDQDYRRLYFYRMFQVLQWHLVALYKHNIGQSTALQIDFEKYANNYLNFAHEYREKIISLS